MSAWTWVGWRRRADSELERERWRLERIIEGTDAGTWEWDVDTGVITIDDRWARMLGYEVSELLPTTIETWRSLVYPDDLATAETAIERHIQGHTPRYEAEFRMRHKDGRWVWILDRGRLFTRTASGGPGRMFGTHLDITAQKQAEEHLRFSELRYRTLVERALDGVVTLGPDRRVLSANASFGALVGIPPAELTGRLFDDLVNADERASAARRLAGPEVGAAPMSEWALVRPDGSVVTVEVNARVLPDGRLLALVRDISARKRAEQAARTAEAEMRRLLDGAERSRRALLSMIEDLRLAESLTHLQTTALNAVANAIVMTDAQGTILWANPAFERLTGYHPDEVRGQNPRVLKSGAHDDGFYRGMWETIASGRTWHGEVVNRHKDGHLYPEDIAITPVLGPQGVVTHYVAVKQDVTARKQFEAALRESETRFQQVTEHVGEWVWEVDKAGLYTYASPVVEKVLGYRSDELVGALHFYDLFAPEHRAAQQAAAFAHFRDGRPFVRFRNEARHKDGRPVVLQTSGTPLFDADGVLKGYRGVSDDITERERLEAQYLRAQRLEGIGALASGIAHDLNNILAPILMAVPLVREATREPESQALLETVELSAARGADIIKQLLTFARGKPGVRVPLPLRHLVRDMAKIVAETFPRDIQVRTDVAGDLWPVLGDATQLHQALMNLCVNSRDAMPDGGLLTITARNASVGAERAALNPDASPGDHVCVSVSDTGEGIPKAHLDRIFDPFFTTKEVGHGTGLGLATLLGIVRGHGGFIQVDTREGGGTTFDLYFPAAPHHVVDSPALPASRTRGGAGELVLVVDDEAPIRETVRTALESAGYRVVVAMDGAEGLASFRTHRHEVKAVLTDMMMPVMNGPTMIGRLRSLAPDVAIVGMTGLPERAGVKGLDGLELSSLLTKPFSVDDLLAALDLALRASGAADSRG